METTAKCVSMGHAYCRTRLSRRSAAAFQRGHSHAGGSRAGSGNPMGGEVDKESFGPGSGGSVCDSSDITLSPLVITDSYSSTGAGCYGTDLAKA